MLNLKTNLIILYLPHMLWSLLDDYLNFWVVIV